MTIAVFTARIGVKTDVLRDPRVVDRDVTYTCASDRDLRSKVWRRLPMAAGLSPVMAARRFKIRLHESLPQAKGASPVTCYLWMDAAFRLNISPHLFETLLGDYDVLALRHPDRKSLADEAQILVKRGLAPHAILQQQLTTYRQAGYPDAGLTATGLLVRRVSDRVAAFNTRWFAEFSSRGHTRDQMSFDYAAWATGMKVGYLDGSYRENPYATWLGANTK